MITLKKCVFHVIYSKVHVKREILFETNVLILKVIHFFFYFLHACIHILFCWMLKIKKENAISRT